MLKKMNDKHHKFSAILWGISFLVGFIVAFVLINSEDPDTMHLMDICKKINIILFPLAFVLSALVSQRPWLCALCLLCGVGGGVCVDALTDTSMERNLFPIEMVMWQGMAFPAVMIGMLLGLIPNRFIKHIYDKRKAIHSSRRRFAARLNSSVGLSQERRSS